MKMELIQPFINAADAVLSQGLQGSTKVGNLTMEEQAYRRKGVAGIIALTGDIEGRIILDLDPQTAVKVASHYAGAKLPESDELIKETVFELANQVTGNAISALNDLTALSSAVMRLVSASRSPCCTLAWAAFCASSAARAAALACASASVLPNF